MDTLFNLHPCWRMQKYTIRMGKSISIYSEYTKERAQYVGETQSGWRGGIALYNYSNLGHGRRNLFSFCAQKLWLDIIKYKINMIKSRKMKNKWLRSLLFLLNYLNSFCELKDSDGIIFELWFLFLFVHRFVHNNWE